MPILGLGASRLLKLCIVFTLVNFQRATEVGKCLKFCWKCTRGPVPLPPIARNTFLLFPYPMHALDEAPVTFRSFMHVSVTNSICSHHRSKDGSIIAHTNTHTHTHTHVVMYACVYGVKTQYTHTHARTHKHSPRQHKSYEAAHM